MVNLASRRVPRIVRCNDAARILGTCVPAREVLPVTRRNGQMNEKAVGLEQCG